MILLISNWFTDQKIAMFAAGMACISFIGPGFFDLSPPKYFGSHKTAIERVVSAQNSKVLSMRSTEPFSPVIKDMHAQTKNPETPGTGLAPNLRDLNQKRQTKTTDPEEESSESSLSSNRITGDIAQLSRSVKPAKPGKIPSGENTEGVEFKQTLETARATQLLIPREFVKNIPTSHQALSGSAQKASFFKIALPLILAGNEEVMQRREAIGRANQNGDRVKLEKWARLYDIKITGQDNSTLTNQLLRRADVIPVPIALAQAAVESGWGTSRFAIKGNALFGQWAWRDDAGLRPLTPTNDRAVVRSFGTLFGSVRAYIHNLNTHPYYENFRNARAALYDRSEERKTKVLVKHLDRYAEIGPVYVTKLEELIRTNNFGQYAQADLIKF